MLLHTVSKSPFRDSALSSCLRTAQPGSVLLLIEDGVYAALAGSEAAAQIRQLDGVSCYVLEADTQARGLLQQLDDGFELVDYAGFVRLSIECHAVQSWY